MTDSKGRRLWDEVGEAVGMRKMEGYDVLSEKQTNISFKSQPFDCFYPHVIHPKVNKV
jgi:hypothetical protein